jgi:predicted nucleic-acid-binding protein
VRSAADTNVVVRWIVGDDLEQTERATAVFEHPTFISLTVLIETVWVLSGRRYALDRATVADLLDRIVAARSVLLEHESAVSWAISRYRAGADFADMIHLIAAADAERFVTFDLRLAGQAGASPPLAIETLA